ncbi:uncharacterized protein LOC116618313 [Nematostella vectensis]|uniref:uncharacterized protein LOC116618313 n=1 Tax=Nematostella vectensis TaxID=45351 RepID=UPI0020777503|nr:uncharacterized protein LOC116618313 [Nematostella vectensis]
MPRKVSKNAPMKKLNFKSAFSSMGKLMSDLSHSELMDSDSESDQDDKTNKMWATPASRLKSTSKMSFGTLDSDYESEDELSMTFPPPRRSQTPVSEVARLEKIREILEDKIEDMKQRSKKPGTSKGLRDSMTYQIGNMESKLENLLKRIVLEGRRGEGAAHKPRTLSLERPFRSSLGFSSHSIIERRKEESKLAVERVREVMEKQKQDEELENESRTKGRERPVLEAWGESRRNSTSRPQSQASKQNSTRRASQPKVNIIQGPPPSTRKFFPPIPAYGAKKRPRDAVPPWMRQSDDFHGRSEKTREKEKRINLIPNRKRVAGKRAAVIIKQLNFEEAYGMESKASLENFNDVMGDYGEQTLPEFTHPPISRQKLYMMGALSRRHLYPPTEKPYKENTCGDEKLFWVRV